MLFLCQAGVFPADENLGLRLPCVSGGVSCSPVWKVTCTPSSPRKRGCFFSLNISRAPSALPKVHNPEIFVREIQTLRTLVRHFHTGAILKSHTAVHIFSYENPEITYTEQEKY